MCRVSVLLILKFESFFYQVVKLNSRVLHEILIL